MKLGFIWNSNHEVKIVMEFRTASELVVGLSAAGDRDNASNTTSIFDSSGVSLQSAALYVDYIYLDTEERRRFAQMSHKIFVRKSTVSNPVLV